MASVKYSAQRHGAVDLGERAANKQGRVLRVMPDDDRILVEGIHIIKKNVKPNPQKNIKGGIAEQEAPVHISNVMLVCPDCGPTRVGHKFEGDVKVRVCKKCGTTLAGEEEVVQIF